jgi:hypothetical protein
MRSRCGLLLLVLCLAAATAQAQGEPSQCTKAIGKGEATFCDGYYALCIKAKCKPATAGPNKSTEADCQCVVEKGWSMGPAPCTDPTRSQTTPPAGNTALMSTYSNRFNKTDKTLVCAATDQQWAWCYGAPCTVDPSDPKQVICRCPVCSGKAYTLGGDCKPPGEACRELWSGATPLNDKFANQYFYDHQTAKGYPALKPAAMCITHVNQ